MMMAQTQNSASSRRIQNEATRGTGCLHHHHHHDHCMLRTMALPGEPGRIHGKLAAQIQPHARARRPSCDKDLKYLVDRALGAALQPNGGGLG